MERTEAELIAAVLKGDAASFEPLVVKYSPRIFAMARRYARRESEVEDIAQEVWLKAFEKLGSFRAEAPFEHWLMRLSVRICIDFLRRHQRNRETTFAELTEPEGDWLERFVVQPDNANENAEAARQLLRRAGWSALPAEVTRATTEGLAATLDRLFPTSCWLHPHWCCFLLDGCFDSYRLYCYSG